MRTVDQKLLDLYSDYLITSFSLATATGLSNLVDGSYSHARITRFLGKERYDQKTYWKTIKPTIREVERDDGAVLIEDTIEEKPHTDENDFVCYHYDHSQDRTVKGINIVNFVYHTTLGDGQNISLPVAFQLVAKTEVVQDEKTGKYKRKSPVSKNEMVRERLKILVQHNRLKFKYVLWDSWFSAKDNMVLVKQTLKKAWRQDKLLNRDLTAPLALRRAVLTGDFEGYVHFLSPDDGEIVGRERLDAAIVAAPRASGGGAIVQTQGGTVALIAID